MPAGVYFRLKWEKHNCQNPRPLIMSADTFVNTNSMKTKKHLQVILETARLWEYLSTKFVLQEKLIVCDWMTGETVHCGNSERDCRIPLKCLNISDVLSVPWSLHPCLAQSDLKPDCDHIVNNHKAQLRQAGNYQMTVREHDSQFNLITCIRNMITTFYKGFSVPFNLTASI